MSYPTAVQAVDEAHETAVNKDPIEVTGGLGVFRTVHFVPFHTSTKVRKAELPSWSPTAVHAVLEVHETPLKTALVDPNGVWVFRITHFVPIQASASIESTFELLSENPTAVHDPTVAQETARSSVSVAPAGMGVFWITHFVPFHASARPPFTPLAWYLPTAVQVVFELHETPLSTASVVPNGLGVFWITHVTPFHPSARVNVLPELSEKFPTAGHSIGDEHETPFRTAFVAPAGSGTGWFTHVAPFCISAIATVEPELPTSNPTAMHVVADGHETPLSSASLTPAGLGVGWIIQPDVADAARGAPTPAMTMVRAPATKATTCFRMRMPPPRCAGRLARLCQHCISVDHLLGGKAEPTWLPSLRDHYVSLATGWLTHAAWSGFSDSQKFGSGASSLP
jgi:hypothetical protein